MNYDTVVSWDVNLIDVWYTDAENSLVKGLVKAGVYIVTGAPAVVNGYYMPGAMIQNAVDKTWYVMTGTTAACAWTLVETAAGVPKTNLTATTAPGVGNDNTQGYAVGSLWFNKNTGLLYVAQSVGTGTATWAIASSSTNTTIKTYLPSPNSGYNDFTAENDITDNTHQSLFLTNIPNSMVVNEISVMVTVLGSSAGNGTFTASLYSEDGQTRLFSVTSATLTYVSGTKVLVTVAVPSISVPAGNYYFGVNANGSALLGFSAYSINLNVVTSSDLGGGVTGKEVLNGRLTITASTAPATFNPTSIVAGGDGGSNGRPILVRFDN